MNNIKAVFFDFDNTIVDYVKSDIDSLRIVAKSLPIAIDTNDFIDIAVEQIMKFHDLVSDGKVKPSNIHNYRLYNTLKYFSVEWEKEYLDIYLQHFIKSTVCFSGVEEVIRYLYGKVKLGILTNAYNSEEQKRRIGNTGIARYFDDIVVCADIGAYKPAKEAFLYLVDKYGLTPADCLYIGDSEEYDIKGAGNAGLYTIKMVHNSLKINSVANYVCGDFQDLFKLFVKKLVVTGNMKITDDISLKECARDIVLEDVSKHTMQLIWFLNNDECLVKHLGSNNSVKISEQEFSETNKEWIAEKHADMFAIVLRKKAIGLISLSHQDTINHTARIGYWIGSTYWNKGYTSKAFQLVLDQAKIREIKYVFSTIRRDNIASRKIWDKYGAQTEYKNDKYLCTINISEV